MLSSIKNVMVVTPGSYCFAARLAIIWIVHAVVPSLKMVPEPYKHRKKTGFETLNSGAWLSWYPFVKKNPDNCARVCNPTAWQGLFAQSHMGVTENGWHLISKGRKRGFPVLPFSHPRVISVAVGRCGTGINGLCCLNFAEDPGSDR